MTIDDGIDEKTTTTTRNKTRSENELYLVTVGATANQLSSIFGISHTEVKKRMQANNVPVVGEKNGGNVYPISKAAPHLIPKQVDNRTWIANMSKADMPVKMQSEFWKAQRAKQLFEEHNGDLWRTEAVEFVLGEIFKIFSLSLRLVKDNVAKETTLTPQQRRRVEYHMDSALNEAASQIESAVPTMGIPQEKVEIDE